MALMSLSLSWDWLDVPLLFQLFGRQRSSRKVFIRLSGTNWADKASVRLVLCFKLMDFFTGLWRLPDGLQSRLRQET
jgi:hypothetical protein